MAEQKPSPQNGEGQSIPHNAWPSSGSQIPFPQVNVQSG
jgi:hypothetical protein